MSEKPLEVREVSNQELQITLVSRNELIRELRQKVKFFAKQQGFDDEEVFDVQLALNEALANVIEHAYQGDQNGRIDIKFHTDQNGDLVIVIKDYGQKADPECLKSRSLDEFREGGLGLYLMEKLMDVVQFDFSQEDGTVLTLIKRKHCHK
ncbi:MAG: ATP-binding protein [candidate division KSB1 bacterium]|nr:ATP-binding protein [candidate division KSB1 bacterium]MDQ7062655.1 ATP-binding protein [candidate division KSB1 bacterium]